MGWEWRGGKAEEGTGGQRQVQSDRCLVGHQLRRVGEGVIGVRK